MQPCSECPGNGGGTEKSGGGKISGPDTVDTTGG